LFSCCLGSRICKNPVHFDHYQGHLTSYVRFLGIKTWFNHKNFFKRTVSFVVSYFWFLVLVFLRLVLFCSPGWPGTRDLSSLASRVLGLQVSSAMPGSQQYFTTKSYRFLMKDTPAQQAQVNTQCVYSPGLRAGGGCCAFLGSPHVRKLSNRGMNRTQQTADEQSVGREMPTGHRGRVGSH
jgi:hypothetical protein